MNTNVAIVHRNQKVCIIQVVNNAPGDSGDPIIVIFHSSASHYEDLSNPGALVISPANIDKLPVYVEPKEKPIGDANLYIEVFGHRLMWEQRFVHFFGYGNGSYLIGPYLVVKDEKASV